MIRKRSRFPADLRSIAADEDPLPKKFCVPNEEKPQDSLPMNMLPAPVSSATATEQPTDTTMLAPLTMARFFESTKDASAAAPATDAPAADNSADTTMAAPSTMTIFSESTTDAIAAEPATDAPAADDSAAPSTLKPIPQDDPVEAQSLAPKIKMEIELFNRVEIEMIPVPTKFQDIDPDKKQERAVRRACSEYFEECKQILSGAWSWKVGQKVKLFLKTRHGTPVFACPTFGFVSKSRDHTSLKCSRALHELGLWSRVFDYSPIPITENGITTSPLVYASSAVEVAVEDGGMPLLIVEGDCVDGGHSIFVAGFQVLRLMSLFDEEAIDELFDKELREFEEWTESLDPVIVLWDEDKGFFIRVSTTLTHSPVNCQH